MLNYNKLKYFYTVARHLNMTRAAEELFVGQPSISVHIKELENEFGVSLFVRTNHNLVLTEAGRLLFDRIAPFFDGEPELIRAVRRTGLNGDPKVTVGIVGARAVYRLPAIVNDFRQHYEDVEVKILRLNLDPLNEALRTGAVNVGFQIFAEFAEGKQFNEFNHYHIDSGRVIVALPSSNPLSTRKSIRLSELKNCRFATLNREQSSAPHNNLLEYCRRAGFEPQIAAEFSFIEPLLTMVNIGEAITVTSSLAPLKGLENIRCVDLEDFGPIEFAMIWRKDNSNAATQLFIQHVMNSDWNIKEQ